MILGPAVTEALVGHSLMHASTHSFHQHLLPWGGLGLICCVFLQRLKLMGQSRQVRKSVQQANWKAMGVGSVTNWKGYSERVKRVSCSPTPAGCGPVGRTQGSHHHLVGKTLKSNLHVTSCGC